MIGLLYFFFLFSVLGAQFAAHRIGAQVCTLFESCRLLFHYECLSRNPHFEFHHLVLLIRRIEHMQINLGIDNTVVEQLQFVELFLDKVQKLGVRLEMDGLRKYLHDRNVLRPARSGMLVPAGVGLVIH